MRRGTAGHPQQVHRTGGGQRAVQAAVRSAGRTHPALGDRVHHRRRSGGRGADRLSRCAQARLHPGRHRRRLCRRSGGIRAANEKRAGAVPGPAGAGRKKRQGLQRDRIRGHAGPQRHGHNHLQHGKPGSRGHPYRGFHRGVPLPDPDQQGISYAAGQRAEDHPRVEDRRRLQRAVRAGPKFIPVLSDRGKSPGLPLLGAGLQSQRLSYRPGLRQDRRGHDPGRD